MFDNYQYFTDGKTKVVAVSTYAGKPVRGVAICSPDDEFDLETGKRIAAQKCNYKVAQKRVARATKKFQEARDAVGNAKAHYAKMLSYYSDAVHALDEAENELSHTV